MTHYARALVSTILSRLMSSSIERSLIPRLLIQLYPISQTVEILALKLSRTINVHACQINGSTTRIKVLYYVDNPFPSARIIHSCPILPITLKKRLWIAIFDVRKIKCIAYVVSKWFFIFRFEMFKIPFIQNLVSKSFQRYGQNPAT